MKGMTEFGKWNDKYFRKLSPGEKLTFVYLIETCDHAGFGEIDDDAYEYHVGASANVYHKALEKFEKDKKILISKDKYWIVNALKHRTTLPLSPNLGVHRNIIRKIDGRLNEFPDLLSHLKIPEEKWRDLKNASKRSAKPSLYKKNNTKNEPEPEPQSRYKKL